MSNRARLIGGPGDGDFTSTETKLVELLGRECYL